MSTEEEILKGFVGILEDHFPEASTFLPRDVELGKFLYVNDEELDKRDEHLEDEELQCSDEIIKIKTEDLETDTTCVPLSSVDAFIGSSRGNKQGRSLSCSTCHRHACAKRS